MKVLIEGYSYDPAVVKNILPESRFLLTDKKAKIENVGYYRNPKCDDFVFFLPKVLLEPVKMADGAEEDRVFCRKDGQGNQKIRKPWISSKSKRVGTPVSTLSLMARR